MVETIFMPAAIQITGEASEEKDRFSGRSDDTLRKWKEPTLTSGRRCGARRATDCLHQFHAFPYSPPPVVFTTTYTSIPTTWASHPLSSKHPFLNDRRRKRHTTLFISLRAEDSRLLFRSFSRLEMQFRSSFCRRLNLRALFPLLIALSRLSLDPES